MDKYIKKTLRHKLIKFLGGTYRIPNDMQEREWYYPGDLWACLNSIVYKIKRNISILYYNYLIWRIKRKLQ